VAFLMKRMPGLRARVAGCRHRAGGNGTARGSCPHIKGNRQTLAAKQPSENRRGTGRRAFLKNPKRGSSRWWCAAKGPLSKCWRANSARRHSVAVTAPTGLTQKFLAGFLFDGGTSQKPRPGSPRQRRRHAEFRQLAKRSINHGDAEIVGFNSIQNGSGECDQGEWVWREGPSLPKGHENGSMGKGSGAVLSDATAFKPPIERSRDFEALGLSSSRRCSRWSVPFRRVDRMPASSSIGLKKNARRSP